MGTFAPFRHSGASAVLESEGKVLLDVARVRQNALHVLVKLRIEHFEVGETDFHALELLVCGRGEVSVENRSPSG
jgi:hypothetical protein